jgi:hypothetical protein
MYTVRLCALCTAPLYLNTTLITAHMLLCAYTQQVAISLLFIPKYLQIQAETDASSVVPGAPSPNGNLNRKSDATTKNKKITTKHVASKALSAESNNDYCNSVRAETGPPSPYHAHSAAASASASASGTANATATADITSDTTVTASSVALGSGFAANRAAKLQKAKGSQKVSPDA